MNRILAYILIVASCVLAGCAGRLDIPEDGRADIAFDVSMEQTKALISPANLNTEGNRFMIYDVHTSEKGLDQYIKDQYLQYTQGQWNFVKSSTDATVVRIPWTKKGTHDFLAYNTYDAAASKELPVDVTYISFENDNTLTSASQQSLRVPSSDEWKVDLGSQFDFIYGSASRDVATGGLAPVSISFKHLFAAVAVEVRNISTSSLTLSELSFSNIKDEGVAVIDYSGAVSYELSCSSSTGLFKQTPGVSISAGQSLKLYSSPGEDEAFLVWPHSATELIDVQVVMKYIQGGMTTTKNIVIAENSNIKNWVAGSKYKYLIAISDNNISFDVVRVVEWINDDIILEE